MLSATTSSAASGAPNVGGISVTTAEQYEAVMRELRDKDDKVKVFCAQQDYQHMLIHVTEEHTQHNDSEFAF